MEQTTHTTATQDNGFQGFLEQWLIGSLPRMKRALHEYHIIAGLLDATLRGVRQHLWQTRPLALRNSCQLGLLRQRCDLAPTPCANLRTICLLYCPAPRCDSQAPALADGGCGFAATGGASGLHGLPGQWHFHHGGAAGRRLICRLVCVAGLLRRHRVWPCP